MGGYRDESGQITRILGSGAYIEDARANLGHHVKIWQGNSENPIELSYLKYDKQNDPDEIKFPDGRRWQKASDNTGCDLHSSYVDPFGRYHDSPSLAAYGFEVTDRGTISWKDYNSFSAPPKGIAQVSAPLIEYRLNQNPTKTSMLANGKTIRTTTTK